MEAQIEKMNMATREREAQNAMTKLWGLFWISGIIGTYFGYFVSGYLTAAYNDSLMVANTYNNWSEKTSYYMSTWSMLTLSSWASITSGLAAWHWGTRRSSHFWIAFSKKWLTATYFYGWTMMVAGGLTIVFASPTCSSTDNSVTTSICYYFNTYSNLKTWFVSNLYSLGIATVIIGAMLRQQTIFLGMIYSMPVQPGQCRGTDGQWKDCKGQQKQMDDMVKVKCKADDKECNAKKIEQQEVETNSQTATYIAF